MDLEFIKLSDIDTFLKKMRKNIGDTNKSKNKESIDALIFYFSGHGFDDDLFIDSNGMVFGIDVFKKEFVESKLSCLKNRPKFFFIDTCRSSFLPEKRYLYKDNQQKYIHRRMHTITLPTRNAIDESSYITIYATSRLKQIALRKKGSNSKKALIEHFPQKNFIDWILNGEFTVDDWLLAISDFVNKEDSAQVNRFLTKRFYFQHPLTCI